MINKQMHGSIMVIRIKVMKIWLMVMIALTFHQRTVPRLEDSSKQILANRLVMMIIRRKSVSRNASKHQNMTLHQKHFTLKIRIISKMAY